jgi:ribonucleoside-triphosphate reductase
MILKVIKRNGEEVSFEISKIKNAITKANQEIPKIHQLNSYQIDAIADTIERQLQDLPHAANVEDIQDMVEKGIMEMRGYEVAQKYVRYRFKRELARKANTTDNGILSLIDRMNEEVKQENSNKNPVINSTQRDYMAGEVSKDLTMRLLLPEEVVRAHQAGIIHFHDSDYFAQREHNCDLIDLADMLQNGTVISETMIEKPHSFYTACNITTQIVAQVASNQYGGQTFTLSHLAPFVEVSRKKIRENVIRIRKELGEPLDKRIIERTTQEQLKDEITRGIQTIQYQLITLMTCNGQAPFVTVFMYLGEVPEGQTRNDLAMIIEEVLRQRMQGVKNQHGVWITPAFPKLIYVLDEDNITPDSPYWYLTELAARCTAKRMVPDYISAKVMKELKRGDVYPCMGCRSFLTVEDSQTNADGSHKFYGRFNQGVVTINLVDVACTLPVIKSNSGKYLTNVLNYVTGLSVAVMSVSLALPLM